MKYTRGFSLIELMITLTVLAILLSLAAPTFSDMIQNNRMTTRANDLITALNLARSEAIKRGTAVSITATDDSWNNGWSVAVGGTNLRVFSSVAGTVEMIATGGVTTVNYAGTGMGGPLTVNVCDTGRTGETGRQVSVSATGRVSVANVACN